MAGLTSRSAHACAYRRRCCVSREFAHGAAAKAAGWAHGNKRTGRRRVAAWRGRQAWRVGIKRHALSNACAHSHLNRWRRRQRKLKLRSGWLISLSGVAWRAAALKDGVRRRTVGEILARLYRKSVISGGK